MTSVNVNHNQLTENVPSSIENLSGLNNNASFYIKDHLGSTRMVLNDDFNIVEATAYMLMAVN